VLAAGHVGSQTLQSGPVFPNFGDERQEIQRRSGAGSATKQALRSGPLVYIGKWLAADVKLDRRKGLSRFFIVGFGRRFFFGRGFLPGLPIFPFFKGGVALLLVGKADGAKIQCH
jgi:hypothetical protein